MVQPLTFYETSLPRGRFSLCGSHVPVWKPEVHFPDSLVVGPSHVTQAHQSEASHEPPLQKREDGAAGTHEGSVAGRDPGLCGQRWNNEIQLPGPGLAVGSGWVALVWSGHLFPTKGLRTYWGPLVATHWAASPGACWKYAGPDPQDLLSQGFF